MRQSWQSEAWPDRARLRCSRGAGGKDEEDINAELGVGTVAADADLDAAKDAAERQILEQQGLLAPYARIVASGARPSYRASLCDARRRGRCRTQAHYHTHHAS